MNKKIKTILQVAGIATGAIIGVGFIAYQIVHNKKKSVKELINTVSDELNDKQEKT